MSSFKIEFDTNNAAFTEDEGDLALETARLLRETADSVEAGKQSGSVIDLNGNRVGYYRFTA